jgi:Spy/CpxP family protein refolding chaperone
MRYSKSAGTTIVIGFVVLLCMLTTVLVAEISPVPKLLGFGWRKALPTHLLRNEAVRAEIGLTDELVQQIKNFRSELESESRSQHAKVEAKWNELLTLDQKRRLGQIHLQEASLLEAFSDEEVIKELGGFSSEQQKRIHDIHKRYHIIKESFGNKLRGSGQQYSKEEFRKIVDDRMKENEIALRTNLMKVLTPEQKEKFDELKGPPFESLDRKHR